MLFFLHPYLPIFLHCKLPLTKVDISRVEKMEFKSQKKVAFKIYSDIDEYQLLCYTLEEVLIEKMRSVIQRMQARDLYDIWYLLEEHGLDVDFYLNEFKNKCISKGLDPSSFPTKFLERIPQYRGRWQVSMKDQIKELPGFEKVEREVQRHLNKLKFPNMFKLLRKSNPVFIDALPDE